MKFDPHRERYGQAPTFDVEGPIDLTGSTAPPSKIELEIGFGRGHFLMTRAASYPSTLFWGIETRRKWVYLVDERARQRQLRNINVRCADIRRVLPRVEADACLDRVFVNFPDPWWKARHAKRIVITTELIAQLSRLLKPGGEVFVQTDVEDRARAYLQTLQNATEFEPATPSGRVASNPFEARSLREIRCEEVELPIHRLLFRRR